MQMFGSVQNDANLAAQGTQALSQGTQPLPQGNQTNASAVPPGLAPPVAGNAGGRVQIKKKAAAQKNEVTFLQPLLGIICVPQQDMPALSACATRLAVTQTSSSLRNRCLCQRQALLMVGSSKLALLVKHLSGRYCCI